MTERALNPVEASQLIDKQDRQAAIAKAKAEQAAQEEDGRRWEQYKRKVRREEEEKAGQRALEREALAAMSPQEYDSFKRRVPDPGLAPRLPTRYTIALQDIRTEDAQAANREREEREREDGTLERREKYDRAQLELITQRDADLQAERERHRTAEEAIRERAEGELLLLGARP
jgi:hypothetical protein